MFNRGCSRMMGDSDVWKKTEVDKLISHLGSLLHQEIWPTQVVSLFPTLYVLPLAPGWRASSSPLVDASCPVCVWLKEIHMRDRGLTHTTLDQKEFGEKVWSPFACALNLQGFRFQQRLGPHLSPYSFPEEVKA